MGETRFFTTDLRGVACVQSTLSLKKEAAVHRLYEEESLIAYDIVLCDLSLKASASHQSDTEFNFFR